MINFKKLRKQAMLGKSKDDKVIKEIVLKVLENSKLLSKIDTTGVKPANFPYELKRSFLRDDENIRIDDEKIFKNNAETDKDNYVVIKDKDE